MKPNPTNAYVDVVLGHRQVARTAKAKTKTVGSHADAGTGKKSARIIPSAAAEAKPTNGWRARQRLGRFLTSLPIKHNLPTGFTEARGLSFAVLWNSPGGEQR
jgi:hypothetical protein